jgi:hypothetical protein
VWNTPLRFIETWPLCAARKRTTYHVKKSHAELQLEGLPRC